MCGVGVAEMARVFLLKFCQMERSVFFCCFHITISHTPTHKLQHTHTLPSTLPYSPPSPPPPPSHNILIFYICAQHTNNVVVELMSSPIAARCFCVCVLFVV